MSVLLVVSFVTFVFILFPRFANCGSDGYETLAISKVDAITNSRRDKR